MSTHHSESLGASQFEQRAPSWRVLDRAAWAWFATDSTLAAADLAARSIQLWRQVPGAKQPAFDVRREGLGVRIATQPTLSEADADLAAAIEQEARVRGARPEPGLAQEFTWQIDTLDPTPLVPFWTALTGMDPDADQGWADQDLRRPRIEFVHHQPSPMRDRFHLDISLPESVGTAAAAALDAAGVTAGGPYGVRRADGEGNEVDLIVGDPLPAAEDWSVIFGAQVFYPTSDPDLAVDLSTAAALLADRHDLSVQIDLRPSGVYLDSAKDRWEEPGFAEFAVAAQAAARGFGLTAEPRGPFFVQVGLCAVDILTVRTFWQAILGYVEDPRPQVTDLNDPRLINHPILLQDLEPDDTERLAQRNRIGLRLTLPADQLENRQQAGLAAGGQLIATDPITLADPEGNRVQLVAAAASDSLGHLGLSASVGGPLSLE